MLSVSHFSCVRKGKDFIITGMETLLSPCCKRRVFVHGTCKRKLKTPYGNVFLRLRVMECECGMTHREMPDGIIPHKRYSVEMLCKIIDTSLPDNDESSNSIDEILFPNQRSQEEPEEEQEKFACDACMRDLSVCQRLVKWVLWFIEYAQSIEATQSCSAEVPESLCDKLRHYIRAVVNSGKWKQHDFAMRDQ